MIEGKSNMTENSYREIELDSSSSLKDFSFDRKKYHKKYVLNENISEEETQASVTGKLVETLLLEPETFNEKFYTSSCESPPTGLMLEFVNLLVENTIKNTVDGNLTIPYKDLLQETYSQSSYKISFKAVLDKFNDSDAEIYYYELLRLRNKNLTAVGIKDLTNASNIVEELKENEFTRDLIGLVNSKKYTIYNQYKVQDFSIDGFEMKAMIDKVVIDHWKHTVQPYDLKCVWSVENFYENYYLYRRAYIQAYTYFIACKKVAELLSAIEEETYIAQPLWFIVCDSSNYYSPLIYTLNEKDMEDAYNGFDYKGISYPGVKNIIKDLKFALNYNIWNISRENYLSRGIVNLT